MRKLKRHPALHEMPALETVRASGSLREIPLYKYIGGASLQFTEVG